MGLVDKPIASPNMNIAPRLTRLHLQYYGKQPERAERRGGYFWPSNTQVNVIFIINCMLIVQSSNLFSSLTLFVDDNGRRQRTTIMNNHDGTGNENDKQQQTMTTKYKDNK